MDLISLHTTPASSIHMISETGQVSWTFSSVWKNTWLIKSSRNVIYHKQNPLLLGSFIIKYYVFFYSSFIMTVEQTKSMARATNCICFSHWAEYCVSNIANILMQVNFINKTIIHVNNQKLQSYNILLNGYHLLRPEVQTISTQRKTCSSATVLLKSHM